MSNSILEQLNNVHLIISFFSITILHVILFNITLHYILSNYINNEKFFACVVNIIFNEFFRMQNIARLLDELWARICN